MSNDIRRLLGMIQAQQKRLDQQQKFSEEVRDLLRASQDSPKYIDTIPGRRVPYMAAIELAIAADSTSKVEGQFTNPQDGPFVLVGIGLFFRRTEGSYGVWGPANTLKATISEVGQQHGYGFLLDQPHCISGDVELSDQGSGRLLQDRPIASAAFDGPYVLPVEFLVDTASVIKASFSPNIASPFAGIVQVDLMGYKVVQGNTIQP